MTSFSRVTGIALVLAGLLPHHAFAQSGGSLPASGSNRGTCSFRCVSATNPDGERLVPQRIIACTTAPTDQTCLNECNRICPITGAEGNNILPITSGEGLRCARDPVPTCVVPNRSPAQPAAGTNATAGTGGAPGQTANTAAELPNPLGTTDLVVLFGRVVRAVTGILGALALLWFIWGGVLWMTAGESKRTEEAKTVVKNAALGIVILFFSYGLATAFLSIFEETGRRSAQPAGPLRDTTPSAP